MDQAWSCTQESSPKQGEVHISRLLVNGVERVQSSFDTCHASVIQETFIDHPPSLCVRHYGGIGG